MADKKERKMPPKKYFKAKLALEDHQLRIALESASLEQLIAELYKRGCTSFTWGGHNG